MMRIVITVVFCCMFVTANAQQSHVSKVRVEQSDEQFVIMYDLAHEATIEVHVSIDGGTTFRGPLQHVLGSAGKNVPEGRGKVVIWNALREFGEIDYPNAVIKIVATTAEAMPAKTGQLYLLSVNNQIYSKSPFAHLENRTTLVQNRTIFDFTPREQQEINSITKSMSLNRNERREINRTNQQNMILPPDVRRTMQTNADALKLYNMGKRREGWGSLFGLSGLIAIPVGISLLVNDEYTLGSIWGAAGIISWAVGFPLSKNGTKKIQEAVRIYNDGLPYDRTTMELKFGITGNGAGMALRF